MKTSKEDLILQRFDRLEAKFDRLIEEVVPKLREDIAAMKERSMNMAKIITGIGGIVTFVASTAIAWLRH